MLRRNELCLGSSKLIEYYLTQTTNIFYEFYNYQKLIHQTKSEAVELMKEMVKHSRAERGCRSYEYFEGLTETNQIVLLQEWRDAECLQDHYQSQHMEEFLSKLGSLLEREVTTRSYVTQEEGNLRRAKASPVKKDNDRKSSQTLH